jgi:hypothetical protein
VIVREDRRVAAYPSRLQAAGAFIRAEASPSES